MVGENDEMAVSRAEYISDAVVHVTGLVLVVACVPVLIVVAALLGGSAAPVAAATIYGACFAAMIGCSALYNMLYGSPRDWLWRRLDHSAIYLKIAGTFTAFALMAGQGLTMLGFLWCAAIAGVSLKLWAPHRLRWLSITLYLGMGWLGAMAGWSIFAALPPAVLVLVTLAGTLYTVGVGFYLWEALPHNHTVWHVFVLVASLLLYSAVIVGVIG